MPKECTVTIRDARPSQIRIRFLGGAVNVRITAPAEDIATVIGYAKGFANATSNPATRETILRIHSAFMLALDKGRADVQSAKAKS